MLRSERGSPRGSSDRGKRPRRLRDRSAFRSAAGGAELSAAPLAAPRPPGGLGGTSAAPAPPPAAPRRARPPAPPPPGPYLRRCRSASTAPGPSPDPTAPRGHPRSVRGWWEGGGGGSGPAGVGLGRGGDKSSCAQNKGARGWLWWRSGALRMGDFRWRGFARAVPVLPLNCRANVCGRRRSQPASGRR